LHQQLAWQIAYLVHQPLELFPLASTRTQEVRTRLLGSFGVVPTSSQRSLHWWQRWDKKNKRRPDYNMPRSRRRATHTPEELEQLNEEIQARTQQGASPILHTPSMQRKDNTSAIESALLKIAQMSIQKPSFKPPKYDGATDVELFITQFKDVAEANSWTEKETTLHLRASLEGPAAEAGRAQTANEIYECLQGRYGMSDRQARDKLDNFRRGTKQNLHDYGAEISKLIQTAYPTMDSVFRTRTALEKFQKGLNHPRLQQHLLTRVHHTIPEAVKLAEDFLQYETHTSIQSLETEVQVEQVQITPPGPDKLDLILKSIEALIAAQANVLAQASRPTQTSGTTRPNPIGPCFHCGKPGHLKKDCRKLKSTIATQPTEQPSGNASRPAQ